mmetsp:Transcript_49325/g.107399  ORF Transcript_49325/g.107399 Transcript_49325/m.107399 type:complete len:405 (+) Transcript_49325:115-1329(+)
MALVQRPRALAAGTMLLTLFSPLVGAKLHSRMEASDGVIPEWKLDMRFNPSKLIEPIDEESTKYEEGVDTSVYAPGSETPMDPMAMSGQPLPAFGSTPSQDTGACPMMKLPETIQLLAKDSTVSGQTGKWTTLGNVVLGNWVQNFWAKSWQSVFAKSVDGRLAMKIVPMNEVELHKTYGWKAKALNYPNITAMDMSKEVATPIVEQVYSTADTFVIVDCDNVMLFVVHFLPGTPMSTDIYDRYGQLIAHSLDDPVIARSQFVDTYGYLLATAESPGLFANISREDMPVDESKGNILPYVMHFEPGGYTNASRLLDEDYRWVLSTAVQVRAIREGLGSREPGLSVASSVTAWFLLAVLLFCIGWLCIAFYHMVYPRSSGRRSANPFIRGAEKQSLLPGLVPTKVI